MRKSKYLTDRAASVRRLRSFLIRRRWKSVVMKTVRRQGRGPVIGKLGWNERKESIRATMAII